VTYNFFATNKRKVPRYHRAKPAVKAKVRLRELRRKGVAAKDLRGTIGKSIVFAAAADVVDRQRSGLLDADGVRDRLGLDDRYTFGRDQFMVVYV
jgi:hypothetical protein